MGPQIVLVSGLVPQYVAIERPIRNETEVSEGIAKLREHFAGTGNAGSAQYARFLGQEGEGDAAIQLRRYAHGAVCTFLEAWGEAQAHQA